MSTLVRRFAQGIRKNATCRCEERTLRRSSLAIDAGTDCFVAEDFGMTQAWRWMARLDVD
jgi:hypothetical protein